MMSIAPIKISEFKPILSWVTARRIAYPERTIWVHIRIPPGFEMDLDKIKAVFKEDVLIEWERNEKGLFTCIKGRISNIDISEYFINELSHMHYYNTGDI